MWDVSITEKVFVEENVFRLRSTAQTFPHRTFRCNFFLQNKCVKSPRFENLVSSSPRPKKHFFIPKIYHRTFRWTRLFFLDSRSLSGHSYHRTLRSGTFSVVRTLRGVAFRCIFRKTTVCSSSLMFEKPRSEAIQFRIHRTLNHTFYMKGYAAKRSVVGNVL